MGKTGLYLKISILVIALIGVFIAIRGLTTEKMQSAFQALGIEPGASAPTLQAGGEPLANGETRRTLCQTRVHAVHFADGRVITERPNGLKLDWVAVESDLEANGSKETTPDPKKHPISAQNEGRIMNYLEMEKWLSLHCQFVAEPAPKPTDEDLQPSNEPKKYVVFDFIDGSHWELYRAGKVLSSAADPKDRFVSPDLEKALDDLRGIAGFPVDTKGR